MTTTNIKSLPTRKQKREMECDLVKKSTICKEKETKGKVMVLSLFMKNRVVSNLKRNLIVTIHRSRMGKENSHIHK
jgi:hypothetical protein